MFDFDKLMAIDPGNRELEEVRALLAPIPGRRYATESKADDQIGIDLAFAAVSQLTEVTLSRDDAMKIRDTVQLGLPDVSEEMFLALIWVGAIDGYRPLTEAEIAALLVTSPSEARKQLLASLAVVGKQLGWQLFDCAADTPIRAAVVLDAQGRSPFGPDATVQSLIRLPLIKAQATGPLVKSNLLRAKRFYNCLPTRPPRG